jgi:hypothetical protein
MPDARKSLMRSLGEFVGHIRHGLRTPVEPDPRSARRVTTDEAVVEASDERTVVVRRTVIEEVEVRDSESPQP